MAGLRKSSGRTSKFSYTEDVLTNTVKKRVFDVEDGKAILASDHPIMIELARLTMSSSR